MIRLIISTKKRTEERGFRGGEREAERKVKGIEEESSCVMYMDLPPRCVYTVCPADMY